MSIPTNTSRNNNHYKSFFFNMLITQSVHKASEKIIQSTAGHSTSNRPILKEFERRTTKQKSKKSN